MPTLVLFWAAFVLTRPLGATVGDFLTKPVAKGGLNLGTALSSSVLLAVLVGLTTRMTLKARADRQELAEYENRARWRGGRLVTGRG